jgi:hypothetical protein
MSMCPLVCETSANTSQDFGHQMQVCPPPPGLRRATDEAFTNPQLCNTEHWYDMVKAGKHGKEAETGHR